MLTRHAPLLEETRSVMYWHPSPRPRYWTSPESSRVLDLQQRTMTLPVATMRPALTRARTEPRDMITLSPRPYWSPSDTLPGVPEAAGADKMSGTATTPASTSVPIERRRRIVLSQTNYLAVE
jgi:hypothetical protein